MQRRLADGDASVSHPFASLVVTFRFLEERDQLSPGDPWFVRLRDAYLEPWGGGLAGAFALAIRVGAAAGPPAPGGTPRVRQAFAIVLRRAVVRALEKRATPTRPSRLVDAQASSRRRAA